MGTVIAAAVGLGIGVGTLNTKLDHIEKFVDTASDASTGIFVRLATIQKTLDVLEKDGNPDVTRSGQTGEIRIPPIDVKVPAIEVRPGPMYPANDRVIDKLIEYVIDHGAESKGQAKQDLENKGSEPKKPKSPEVESSSQAKEKTVDVQGEKKPESKSSEPEKSNGQPGIRPTQLALSSEEIRQLAIKELQDLEYQVIRDKKMAPETKKGLLNLIGVERLRAEAFGPTPSQ